ncbi:MAG: heparinase II/III family protein [Bacteroidaceae bacterium]|nr:heparinase II/III family protein [Bacteroidaceae bacterium]
MEYGKILRTICHLRPTQVVYQIATRLRRVRFREAVCPAEMKGERGVALHTSFIDKPQSVEGDAFTFLNVTRRFADWNDTAQGMLWAYNLNYMDYLLQADMDAFDGRMWIERFLRDLPARTIGLDPYPTALRMMNWAKFFAKYYTDRPIPEPWRNAMYAQLLHLERRREYHLLGNHLLEDAFALYIGWLHFDEQGSHLQAASKLLIAQLHEQTLTDGAHYEQSPMYHCILLDRLLDALNFARARGDSLATELSDVASRWLGWLESIAWKDGSIPLFGDSARGIAPSVEEIRQYAHRLGLQWSSTGLRESGYRKLQNARMEVVADIGQVTATYQPGHTHSDVFTFEMRVDGKPFVVDTGISTYEKNARRQYERSYEAHNVAQMENEEPFEVWGGFRVGRTARVSVLEDETHRIAARRKSGKRHAVRTFAITDTQLVITDTLSASEGVARFHLSSEVTDVKVQGTSIHTPLAQLHFKADKTNIALKRVSVAEAYNQLQETICIEVTFSGTLTTTIET